MEERPKLNKDLDVETFQNHYYLKEELVAFCRENHLPIKGDKKELTERISYFLSTGKVLKSREKRPAKVSVEKINEDTIIESNISFSEKHRAFF